MHRVRMEQAMRLKSLSISGQWQLNGFTLRSQNLIVGVNASGKSMVVARIRMLASLVAGDAKPDEFHLSRNVHMIAEFENIDGNIKYELGINESQVVVEKFIVGTETLMSREEGGTGKIRYLETGKDMEFQSPQSMLAVVSREDSKQHPFFQPLYQWGRDLYCAHFGTNLGKPLVMIVGPTPASKSLQDPTIRPNTEIIILLQRGLLSSASDKFKKSIIDDMTYLGYFLDDIGLTTAPELLRSSSSTTANFVNFGPQVSSSSGGMPVIMFLKERGLEQNINQYDISQGMWRALAIIIYLNFAKISAMPSCIVIDDIGEGLDFDRSRLLIQLLRAGLREANVQLIMSTNDRFVMNDVPLEDWSVLRRVGSSVDALNYDNSRIVFDNFKMAGLSNFDFFRSEFWTKSDEKAGDIR